MIAGTRNEQLPVGKLTQVVDDGPEKAIWGTTVNVEQTQQTFEHFFRSFREKDEDTEPLYPLLLLKALDTENPNINIDCEHLNSFDPELFKKLVLYPQEVIPIFDIVIQNYIAKLKEEKAEKQEERVTGFSSRDSPQMVSCPLLSSLAPTTEIQIQVRTFNLPEKKSMRDLNPQDINKLVAVKGILSEQSLLSKYFRHGDADKPNNAGHQRSLLPLHAMQGHARSTNRQREDQ